MNKHMNCPDGWAGAENPDDPASASWICDECGEVVPAEPAPGDEPPHVPEPPEPGPPQENDVEHCYRMALTNPLAKDNPFLATTIAMADWIERGRR